MGEFLMRRVWKMGGVCRYARGARVSEESVLLCPRRFLREGLDFSFRGGFTVLYIEFRVEFGKHVR